MYTKKDFSNLKKMDGFSDELLDVHFALYEGYVTNTNKILELHKSLDKSSPEYAETKRRLGWEINGVILHENYFEGLGGDGNIDKSERLLEALKKSFGSFEKWKEDFLAMGKMRGIGWVALYQDPTSGDLMNFWINEHDAGHPSGFNLIFIMDVFEHAFMIDYGKDKPSYIDTFFKNINWGKIEDRLR